jgi:hypothetical protein
MTTATIYTLTLPGLPATLNQMLGRHWSVGAKLKKRDRLLVGLLAKAAGIPKAAGKRRVSVCLVMGPRMRTPDADAPLKSCLDALVAAGMLVDDRKEYLELGTVTFGRGARAETVVTLEDL